MIVALDGPAGSGKSTIAEMLSKKYNLFNLNSGEFYRAFAYYHTKIKNRVITDSDAIALSLKEVCLSLKNGQVCIDGEPIEKEKLHSKEIDNASSVLSTNIDVRKKINEVLRSVASSLDIICEGRDITSVVFPNADIKIYLDADILERAKRRSSEQHLNIEETAKLLKERDFRDMTKPFGALKKVKDAKIIDTTLLTISEVCDKISMEIEGYLQK